MNLVEKLQRKMEEGGSPFDNLLKELTDELFNLNEIIKKIILKFNESYQGKGIFKINEATEYELEKYLEKIKQGVIHLEEITISVKNAMAGEIPIADAGTVNVLQLAIAEASNLFPIITRKDLVTGNNPMFAKISDAYVSLFGKVKTCIQTVETVPDIDRVCGKELKTLKNIVNSY